MYLEGEGFMTAKAAIEVLLNEQKCINRNDGVDCDRQCENCDLVMDVEVIRDAYRMAIIALEAYEMVANVMDAYGELIQCKHCKHYGSALFEDTQFEIGKCYECEYHTVSVRPYDFCSRAERRTDG